MYFDTEFLVLLTYFVSFVFFSVLINMVIILMMSANIATLDLLAIKLL